MASYQVNVDEQLLTSLMTRQEGLGHLVEAVLNQILVAQATELLQAEPHERTPLRQGYRNGQRERTLQTRVGTLTLSVPRLRGGEFSTELFERYQRSEQAFVVALMEMVLQGVSTRKVSAVTEELCGASFSKSTVSALCATSRQAVTDRLDPILEAWRNRPLSGRYPFLLVDGFGVRVREEGQVRQRSALIAFGVNEGGYREVLGLQVGDSESEASWSELFLHLKERGLSGVDLVVSDQHQGLVNAAGRHFQGAVWQRGQVHFVRNIMDACPEKEREMVLAYVRQILEAPSIVVARERLAEALKVCSERAGRAMACLEAGFEDAVAVLSLPTRYRRRLRTTNAVERVNEELRRRERVIRIFPNRASALRLLSALLMEIDESWSTGKVYLDMTEYGLFQAARAADQRAAVS